MTEPSRRVIFPAMKPGHGITVAALVEAVDWLRAAPWLTRERFVGCATGAALFLIGVFAWVSFNHLRGLNGNANDMLGMDFVNYWMGARLAWTGHANFVYDHKLFVKMQIAFFGSPTGRTYSYPPVMMVLCGPFGALPYRLAFAAWIAAGVGACAAVLARMIGWRMAVLAAAGAPAAFADLLTGQNGHLFAALFGGGIAVLDRWPLLAGLLFGALCFKPQLGLLLPVALAAGGRWRAFSAASMTVIGLVAASAVILGPDVWAAFISRIGAQLHAIGSGQHGMQTVYVVARTLGAGPPFAIALQGLSAAAAAAAVVAVWRSDCSPGIKGAVLATGVFLATPYAQAYDMVILVLAAAWLVEEARRWGFLGWEKIAILGLLGLPFALVFPTTPAILWLLMLVFLRRGLTAPQPKPGRERRG